MYRWLYTSLIILLLLAAAVPSLQRLPVAHARWSPLDAPAARVLPPLTVKVQPAQIKEGRDVPLRILVADAKGRPVAGALVSVTGTSSPLVGTAPHGILTLTVHAAALGTVVVQASHSGYGAATLKVPVVPGSPATVVAFKRGMSVLAPKAKPQPGKVGTDLFEQYHALTAQNQYASLALRDGTLVDLDTNTDVLIKDPLHTTLSKGELFLEVVHGSVSHQVQVGSAVAATKGTRLDVRFDPKSKAAVVTVVEGQVQVSNKGKSVLVGAGQQTTVPQNKPPNATRAVDLSKILAWVNNLPNTTSSTVPPVLNLPPPRTVTAPLPPVAATPAITVTGTITSTASWSGGPYLLQGGVTLPAGTGLTIAPGTVVEMGPNAYLDVRGTLTARGTASAPIIFTSAVAKPAPGSWGYLQFAGGPAAGSVLDHVQLFYGSSAGGNGGMLTLVSGANITVTNSVFAQGSAGGIWIDGGTRPTITNCVFAGLAGAAVDAPADDLGVITGSAFGPNQPGLHLEGSAITHNATWEQSAVPLLFSGGTTLVGGVTLSIAPGTVVEMGANAYLIVQGTLTARGTTSAPIIFTSAASQPAPGGWGYLQFAGGPAAGSVLDHVQLFYGSSAGGNGGMLTLVSGANITVTNSVFAQGSAGGIWIDGGTRPTITNCVFAGLAGAAVDAPADDLGVITGSAFGPNQLGLRLEGSTITHSATWERPAEPLLLAGGTTLAADVTLSIAPGTAVQMGPNAYLNVQGTLMARGTASAPIIFTSAASNPAPGGWGYLQFEGVRAAGSVLDHVQLFYGSSAGGAGGMLTLVSGANITVTNSVFAQGSAGGIWIDGGTRPTITNCIFAGLAGYAVDAPIDDLGVITGSAFGPNQLGFHLEAGTITHSASWEQPAVPLVLTAGSTLSAGTTLSLAPGTVVEMGPNAYLNVQGTLMARGTASAPIIFTSADARPTPGSWGYLQFAGGPAAGSVLDHVQLFYGSSAGGAGGMLTLISGANITVTNSVFAQGASGGIWIDSGTRPTITACTFADDHGPAISVPKANAAGIHGNAFAPGQQGVELRS